MYTSQSQLGYSLIETLIAVSILMLSIVAPMTIAIKSIQSSQYALEQNTATFLAQEAISVVEAVRNADALDFIKNGGDSWDLVGSSGSLVYCYTTDGCNFDVSNLGSLISSGAGVVRCENDADCDMYLDTTLEPSVFTINDTPGKETGFVRRVYIEETSDPIAEGIVVRVEVTWQSHFLGTDRGVVLVTSLYDRYDSF